MSKNANQFRGARAAARELRYKKSVAEGFYLEGIQAEMEEFSENIDNIRWCIDGDEGELIEALDGDEEEAFEFRMLFSELSLEACRILDILRTEYITEYFDIFFAAVAHGAVKLIGYDEFEDDYFGMMRYEQEWGKNEAEKKLLKLTKQQLIDCARQCFGIASAILNFRYKVDYLSAAMDVIKGHNHAYIEAIKDIERLYDEADKDGWDSFSDSVKRFDEAAYAMPEKAWIE